MVIIAYHPPLQSDGDDLDYNHRISLTRVKTSGDGVSQVGGDVYSLVVSSSARVEWIINTTRKRPNI